MSAEPDDVPPGGHRPQPRGAVLTYRVSLGRGDQFDPLYLGELAERWGALLAAGMPGTQIERVVYERGELTVEFR